MVSGVILIEHGVCIEHSYSHVAWVKLMPSNKMAMMKIFMSKFESDVEIFEIDVTTGAAARFQLLYC